MRPAFRNVAYNLAGQVLPMAVAVFALPQLAQHAGPERLGFLGLAWALIGYFALFDLGLSRVVTRRIAVARAAGALATEARVVTRIGWSLTIAVTLASALLALTVPARWILGDNASPALIHEAELALMILWATVPATVATGLLRGTLEGVQRFDRANLLRSVFGTWSFAAPLATLPFSVELPALTLSIAIGRYASLLVHWFVVRATLADDPVVVAAGKAGGPPTARPSSIGAMLREGGWLSVSNLVGPVMVTFDRFAIARLVSLAAAGYYFVPQEIGLRLLIVPSAVAATIFPMLATAVQGGEQHARISRDALLATAVACLPPCLVLAALAAPGLALWMGPAFAASSATVAAILAVGLFANCCAQVPFAWIQAAGRPDVTGKLHLAELPFYCGLLCLACWQAGIVGAAIVWSLRALADCTLLLVASRRLFARMELGRSVREIAAGVVVLAALAGLQLAGAGALVVAVPVVAGLAITARMALRLRRHIAQ